MGYKWNHFKTICKHKAVVFKECRACGITWQGLTHDLSKYSREEFLASAKYFQGDRSPIEAEKESVGYSKAWLHHKGCNKHHWEWWTDFAYDGSIIANKIPSKYVIEMLCDCVCAGMARSGEVRDLEISEKILVRAVKNTVQMCKDAVELEGEMEENK